MTARGWDARADAAQHALTRLFGPRPLWPGWRNTSPFRLRDAATLNYWWRAHLIEVRVDAFERTGDPLWLASALRVRTALLRRNRGLFNDYFDDMGWLGIALLRLHRASGDARCLDDAIALWRHIQRAGWQASGTAGVPWRVQQLQYKNAPSNGTFALLSARLGALTGAREFGDYAAATLRWFDDAGLVDPGSGLVFDGVNRLGDGAIDTDWVFSYCQGLYIGALVEQYRGSGRTEPLDAAVRTAVTAVRRLAPSGVIDSENSRFDQRAGGDVGLFKGVFVRYLGELVPLLPSASNDHRMLAGFVRDTTDALWSGMRASAGLRAADVWGAPPPARTFLSTQLSATMALEVRARLEALSPEG
ncbi:glycoside hydrolase family 76 protein [Herbiconiux sp. KACC 21604]|uniref:glycoside hydrolase family 76 protein n=1 Tax=unclassified Herbiconiux TaxID=2618217 RepID=UPI001490FDDD|nr:glycoside hydrolase family 76 protein [Herbiconiux sp. SALV-R1]QJU53259.1 glycosyl hydrolase [Herbiconiux sp. SALV-R1]WPO88217.1 glycoside hydrolase family 76 protein [Herbiconiux sp. KACC 21604]